MQSKKEFSLQNIAHLRQRDGISQQELGDMIGKSQQAVARWEAGYSHSPVKVMIKIADVFDTTLDVLMGRAPITKRRATIEEKLLEFRALDLGLPEAGNVDPLTRQVFEKYVGQPERLKKECYAMRALMDTGKTMSEMSVNEIVGIVLAA